MTRQAGPRAWPGFAVLALISGLFGDPRRRALAIPSPLALPVYGGAA